MKTETKVQHTPTPWSAELVKDQTYRIQDLKKCNVLGTGLNQANAAFIVRAVNAHEELLGASKLVLEIIANGCEVTPHIASVLDKAIAKAEGR